MITTTSEFVISRAGQGRATGAVDADPVTTEIVRHGLNSAAEQMKRALVRTAFSPVIYEVLDFAVAIYDRDVRMLSQAPSIPLFMGTMSFCVERGVAAVGGADALRPGDIILYNDPYGTGSHPQDCAVIAPIFADEELFGYATIKGHFLDIGAKDPYSTDTVDVFQEGTIFPGVRLYNAGELVDDIYRMALANSRLPRAVAGDLQAEVVGVRTGVAAVNRLISRYGMTAMNHSIERMFDHGESIIRGYFEAIPDGYYVGHGCMDSDGITDDPIEFEVGVEVEGSDVRVDFTNVPDARRGPVNCPLPSTVSASRVAISMLAGAGEAPHEGYFRPLEVKTRPGSMFHPLSPSPCFLYGWAGAQSMEVIYDAVARALPQAVPACSGGDVCALVWWGNRRETGEPWADGFPTPVGQGASVRSDGASALIHHSEAATRLTPVEIWETKNPWLLEQVELATDSGGPGRHQGGLGIDFHFTAREDAYLTSVVERTKTAPWGLEGGGEGRANAVMLDTPEETRRFGKTTRLPVPEGATVRLLTGGGGGYGPSAERDAAAVRSDIREGYISEAFARTHYPHTFEQRPKGESAS